jgi:hypothetical protein
MGVRRDLSKPKIDRCSIESATERGKDAYWYYLGLAENLKLDEKKKERREKGLCKLCYYQPKRIGGTTGTTTKCGICEVDLHFGNTCTDLLCTKCAVHNELCKHCGGDSELVRRRSVRPFEEVTPDENAT